MANYTYLTASANIKPMAGKLKGFFVSSASSTPTITVYDSSATSTTQPTILGTFTPAAATSYVLPLEGAYAKNGIYVVIGGTVATTVLFE
jgi:ABC-type nitrate/sulfonate/bicarbonate transport system substrate-binding protein